jgi:ATP diphosphatase
LTWNGKDAKKEPRSNRLRWLDAVTRLYDKAPMSNSPNPAEQAPRFEGAGELERALALVRFLRKHCPWDREQTPRSLIPHLLEEAHEVADAIQEGSPAALEAELGDLLLNLAFQLVLAEETGTFQATAVYRRLEEKMVRRHPQLFGGGERQEWEKLKAAERGADEGVLSGLSRGLDPLTKAHRIQERVAGVGFDWEDYRGAWDKVEEELAEVREALDSADAGAVEEELGDLLFAVVNLTRLAGAHSTVALDRANRKFHRRFEALEALARERDIRLDEAGLEVLDGLWEELKARRRENA